MHAASAASAVSAVLGWPGDSLAPLGMPSAIPRMAASPAAPPHMAEHLCGAQGGPSAKPVLEQWSAAITTPSMRAAHMGLAGSRDMGTRFIRQVLSESQKVWLAHAEGCGGLIKAGAGPGAQRQGIPRAALN